MVKVSVVIRSKNDIAFIERNLLLLKKQTFKDFEIVFFDSGSTDGTLAVIEKYAEKGNIVRIAPEDYVPGRVCNAAVKKARGQFIVFHNSDCIPLDDRYLETLLTPLFEHRAQVTFANQQPRSDAAMWVRKDYKRAFGDGSISEKWTNFFSLAASAFDKSELDYQPFDENLQYSEDVGWAFKARKRGVKIMYVPLARVEHSHNYTPAQIHKRFFNEGIADFQIYGTKISFLRMTIGLCRELVRDFIFACCAKKPWAFFGMMRARCNQRYSLYQGRRAAWLDAQKKGGT